MSNDIKQRAVVEGGIVQIAPDCETNPAFGGCLLIVTEIKGWGVQGYVQALGASRDAGMGGQAYIRLKWDEIEPTGGRAVWVRSEG